MVLYYTSQVAFRVINFLGVDREGDKEKNNTPFVFCTSYICRSTEYSPGFKAT